MFIARCSCDARSVRSCPNCTHQADNKMKLKIEQVGKGGLSPPFPDPLRLGQERG
jgi:hypothetical protein